MELNSGLIRLLSVCRTSDQCGLFDELTSVLLHCVKVAEGGALLEGRISTCDKTIAAIADHY